MSGQCIGQSFDAGARVGHDWDPSVLARVERSDVDIHEAHFRKLKGSV
jgi:hypothetical protein